MPQILKDHVREVIIAGATAVFARDGHKHATMSAMAKAAGVSTGNVYRYFGGKSELFDAVIPPSFVARLLTLLRTTFLSARGHADLWSLPPDAPYRFSSEDLLRFTLENRLRVVVLLGRAQGSRYEDFAESLVKELTGLALIHFQALRPGLRLTAPTRLTVEQAYRNMVATTVLALATYADEADIREAIAAASRFHLAGLKALFEGIATPAHERRIP